MTIEYRFITVEIHWRQPDLPVGILWLYRLFIDSYNLVDEMPKFGCKGEDFQGH